MNKLLRRPHWQVFLYTVVLFMFIPNSLTGTIIQVIWGAVLLIWVLKINEELFDRLNRRSKLNFNLLQGALIISFIYLAVIFLFTDGYEITSEKDNFAEYGYLIYVYVPFTFIALGSYFYALYFTSSLVNQLEREHLNKQEDNSLQLFFALFFYPIGIWWIQPKINILLELPTPTD